MKWLSQFHRRIALQGPKQPLEWLVLIILLPWSLLYGIIAWLRNKCYDWSLFASYAASVPVVSVGNLAAGGTGKTPVVDWLLKEFIRQGKRPAVVSRGYGGSFAGQVGLVSTGEGLLLDANQAGDEPYLLARRNPAAGVFIARKRAAGVRVAVDDFAADVVILDDGFQHRAVQRDLDLVLLDGANPFGNRWPLPAGLLREFPAALKRSDMLLLTRCDNERDFRPLAKPVYRSRHQLADVAVSLHGEQVTFEKLQSLKLFAFAGIAEPSGFFSALTAAGLSLQDCLPLSDHCGYEQSILAEINSASADCAALITTEKDAVKLRGDSFSLPCYQVPMTILLEDDQSFRTAVQQRLWSE